MKMSSNNIVKICVIAVCVIFMCFVCWKLYRDHMAINADDAIAWPPEINKCPDYWEVKGDGRCENVHKVGLCKAGGDNVMDFNDPVFEGKKGMYRKCSWSKQCEAPWEGIDSLC